MDTMEAEIDAALEKIVELTWDNKRKGFAIAHLSEERVKRLRGVPDELFEATLEALLPQGIAVWSVCSIQGLSVWACDKR